MKDVEREKIGEKDKDKAERDETNLKKIHNQSIIHIIVMNLVGVQI